MFPTVSLKQYQDIMNISGQYSIEFISSNGAVKLEESETAVTVGVIPDTIQTFLDYIETFHYPKQVCFRTVLKSELASLVGSLSESGAAAEGVTDSGTGPSDEFSIDSIEQDAPAVNIINSICIEAIKCGASDIHIESEKHYTQIRYRIDGVLHIVRKLSKETFPALSSRIKIMSNLNIMEQRLPQDGRTSVTIAGQTIDIRVSIIPTTNGESIVLRIFNTDTAQLPLQDLGFSRESLVDIKQALKIPYGLVLVTGPTGSGKTTTLHAMLKTLPAESLKIITLEDPVEQVIPGVSQIQINDQIHVTFDDMLRRVLRQDPNVIMVGEIRDSVTAELALRSALTGHLILSTLHTNDSVSVIPRLENMDMEPYLIGAVLKCVIAQRLVRRICPKCACTVEPTEKQRKLLEANNITSWTLKKGSGCDYCRGTGYSGRTVISELFMVDSGLENLISTSKPPETLYAYIKKGGFVSITVDALRKVAEGITTFDEIEREVVFNAAI